MSLGGRNTATSSGNTASDEGWRTLLAYIVRPCICVVSRSWSPARTPPDQWSTANDAGWLTTLAYVVRSCIYAKRRFEVLEPSWNNTKTTAPASMPSERLHVFQGPCVQ